MRSRPLAFGKEKKIALRAQKEEKQNMAELHKQVNQRQNRFIKHSNGAFSDTRQDNHHIIKYRILP